MQPAVKIPPALLLLLIAAAPVLAKDAPPEEPPQVSGGTEAVDPRVYSHFLSATLLERHGELEKALKEYNRTLEIDPSATLIYRQRAQIYLKMGNPARALSDAQHYVRTHPSDVEGLLLLSNIHVMMQQKNAAQLVLEKVLQIDPKNEDALLALATMLMPDSPDQAVKHLERLVQLEPDSTEAYYYLGLLYQRLGDNDKAGSMFQKVLQIDSESAPSLMLMGQMKEAEGDMDGAAEFYERALERMPENLALRIQLVLLHAQKMDFAKIESLLSPYKDNPGAPIEAKLWLGIVYENKKEWKKALEYYQMAQKEVSSAELLIRIASIYSHLDDAKNALKTLTTLTQKYPDNPQYFYFLGLAHMDLQRPGDALKAFQKTLALKPDFSSAHFQMGVALDQMRRWPEAEQSFREAIRVDTMSAAAYNYLGYSLVDRNERLREARRLIESALEIDHDNPAYLDSLGWLLYREGDVPRALYHLKFAAERMPDPTIFEHLGDCYLALGSIADAATSYQRALALEPKNPKLREKLKKLDAHMVPTSPARRVLERFDRALSQASNISGTMLLEARGGPVGLISAGQSRGYFYLRKFDPAQISTGAALSTAPVSTDLRVDLLNPMMLPFVIRYQNLPRVQWRVFPPEIQDHVPQETELILDMVASFLNGQLYRAFYDPSTRVEERRKEFLLTRGKDTLRVDKAEGRILELQNGRYAIRVDRYQKVGGVWLPERMRLALPDGASGLREVRFNFPSLSLDQIEGQIFESGSAQ